MMFGSWFSQSLALPVYPELKKAEKDYIVASIREFFGSKSLEPFSFAFP